MEDKIVYECERILEALKQKKKYILNDDYPQGLTKENVIDEEIHQIENVLIPSMKNASF
jgi:hypothetical protein